MPRNTLIKVRRDTSANLASVVLDEGELAFATNDKILKIGDGSTEFSSLTALTPPSSLEIEECTDVAAVRHSGQKIYHCAASTDNAPVEDEGILINFGETDAGGMVLQLYCYIGTDSQISVKALLHKTGFGEYWTNLLYQYVGVVRGGSLACFTDGKVASSYAEVESDGSINIPDGTEYKIDGVAITVLSNLDGGRSDSVYITGTEINGGGA